MNMMINDPWRLSLYIADPATRLQQVLPWVALSLGHRLGIEVTTEVVDILERPDLATTDEVFATPTLIRRSPEPSVRIIGDLDDPERVLTQLIADQNAVS